MSNQARILVAEDDDALRELVAWTLREAGYDVSTAATGRDLAWLLQSVIVDAFPDEGVDLVIADFRMPGLTGLDVLREIREAHWTLPAILMTAFPSPELQRAAEHSGLVVLAKPFAMHLLLEEVTRLLDIDRERRRERASFRLLRVP